MSTLTAKYTLYSDWELEFDLEKVHSWYIKWDSLYVKHNEHDDYVEYSPSFSAEDCSDGVKRPTDTYLEKDEGECVDVVPH